MNQGTELEAEYTNDQLASKAMREQGLIMGAGLNQEGSEWKSEFGENHSGAGYMANKLAKVKRKASIRKNNLNMPDDGGKLGGANFKEQSQSEIVKKKRDDDKFVNTTV